MLATREEIPAKARDKKQLERILKSNFYKKLSSV